MAITQDKRGYMWFGTATGLNRYDGYEFVVYTHDFNDSLSISDNEITSLYEDDEGFLWVGTTEGILNKFDPKTETFLHFDIANSSDWYSTVEEELYDYPITFSRNQSSTITSITQDKFGNLWIGTWGKGIVRLNPETNNRKYYYYFKHRANSLSSNKIVKILNDNENNLWIGTFGGGLNRISFDSENADQVIIDIFKHDSGFLFGKRITSLFEDFDGKIWIGSYAGGVSVIPSNQKMQSPKAIQYQLLNNEFKSLSGDKILNIMSIIEDFNSKIWVGTYGDGLYSYSKQTKETNHFVAESSDPNSLSENEIQSLFVDNSGILWIGTQLGSGINKYEVNINNFKTIPVLTEINKSLNDNIVWAVHEDKENNIWIGTHRGGLNKWDKEKNEYTYFTNQQNLPDNHIRAITEDKKGNLWIGTYSGGLSYFNKEKSTFKNFTKNDNSNSLNAVQIQSFYNDNDSVLWIGTFGGGLNRLDLKKFYTSGIADFKSYMHNPAESNSISDDRVYIIFKDSQNIFWIGTHGGGLNKFDPKNETFTNFKSSSEIKYSLTDNRIMSIQEAHDGKLLIGTFGGGIDIFDKETLKFENLSKKLALNCSDVYGILMDNDYEYWLSTDNGIFKIDSEFRSFRQYDISDGLQSLEFSGGAYLKGHDGIFYFGGINGINFFDPQKIRIDNYIPPIVISRIKVF
ncbi:MAG: hypothetical protein H6611_07330, partial [Ignavibacteriales bacterium]|nr:hypothetical protein [Ignavibacteriales bacterium]